MKNKIKDKSTILWILVLFVFSAVSCQRVNPTGKLRQAISDAEAGKWDDALFNTDTCLRYDSENINAFILNSFCLLKKNDSEATVNKALYNLEKVTRTSPDRYDSWYIYGWGLYKNGKTTEAIAALEKAISLLPREKKAIRGNLLCMLGNCYLKSNLTDRAFSRLQPLQILQPYSQYPELYNHLGLLSVKEKKYSQAVSFFKQALKVAPENKYVYQNLAVTYDLYLNDLPNARKYYVCCLGAKNGDGDQQGHDQITNRLRAIALKK